MLWNPAEIAASDSTRSSSALRRSRERGAELVALVASLWFAAVAAWEIAAPFGAGHYAASAAVGVAGENLWRFGTLVPLTHHPFGPLEHADHYTNHPFGIFWVQALFARLLGHHDYVCRLPALLESAITPPLLFAIARRLYGPACGALAAVAFALTPIALAFANFNALEVALIFGSLLTSFCVLRLSETGRRRHFAASLGALAFTVNVDWAGFVFAGAVLVVTLLAALQTPRTKQSSAVRRRLRWFTGAGALLVLAIGLVYVFALHQLGKWDALLDQGRFRTQGVETPLLEVLAARRYWILLMFTPLAVGIGLIGAPALLVRAARRRSALELLPLAILVAAVFQYLVFKQGADVHVYWPHHFAPFFALALAALTASGLEVIQRSPAGPRWRAAVLASGFAIPALMSPDAISTLSYARKTGGRFDEHGHFIQPDKDKVLALELLGQRAAPGATFALAANMRQSAWVPWAVGHPVRTAGSLGTPPPERYFVTDGRFEDFERLRRAASQQAVSAIGPFWVVDSLEGPAPAVATSIERREPRPLERFFAASNHAPRAGALDPFATWELRDHLNQTPNPVPSTSPRTLEQLRILHNAALASGDTGRATRLLQRLLGELDRSNGTEYEDGSAVLGVRFERGASDVLSVYFRAPGALAHSFVIRSRLEAPPVFSLVPADSRERRVGLPPFISTSAWKPGYVYGSITEVLARPGRERFVGAWEATTRAALRTRDGRREITLLVLP
jgi:hypothetical protein